MTATTALLSLEDYLSYNDGTDRRYELVNGELIAMSQPKGQHGAITEFLNDQYRAEIQAQGLAWVSKQGFIAICLQQRFAIESPRGGRWDTARIPDVTVATLEQWQGMLDREAIIRLNESPPFLVVEVVSESTRTTDYRSKRVEYNLLEIREYWIVDPLKEQVVVLQLVDDLYEETVFVRDELIESTIFPGLQLSAQQVLNGAL
ncbi:MAG: Uma2 family endonuclease [Moorea sp. SIO1F2]|uniref:Uma2 family endonuclease n=1 Tax=unclassified Moorena TaxID=2683338 RepID=UPI0013B9C521|nr:MULTISPECIES: Uma2 family endonuclease [unclassified Moorena]NEN94696.1 Uma2 family endonuclease [Moorena sp. SIO3I7]NEO09391.1 Uma2 family endonuclease [Moorena sp. SIO3I8]NEO21247.1 Uma2 family endonuclease [Moorena sp. SIO4A5]NEQ56761.1 Uma2 family endonuclease [Moorena sp. SIO4A1]NET85965.1 Uma2 family endonuclease [Moorena sp. SIO1F2]